MARISELLLGFGKDKQVAIGTASTSFFRWDQSARQPANVNYVSENDTDFIGKGHEFATAQFKSHIEVSQRVEWYLSAERIAWLMCYGLGKVVKSGAGPYTYTCTPIAPATDGLELPYFAIAEQMRPGGSAVLDRLLVGCAVRSWGVSIGSGPGMANARCTAEFVGSGQITTPSGVVIPAAVAENYLPASSAAVTIIGVDYVSTPNFVNCEMSWDNAFQPGTGFYPGSGNQDSFQKQGRLEVGKRACGFSFVARYHATSAELTKLKAGTTGTAVITLTLDANNSCQWTWQQMAFSAVEIGESDGVVTARVTGLPMYHATNGVLSVAAKCGVDGICQ